MKTIKTGLALAAVAVVALPVAASAAASRVVPPGNSAAAQYTEAIPTGGGDKSGGSGGKGGHRSPAKVLGAKKTHRLESQGPQGRAAAEVAAATAPTVVATPEASASRPSQPPPPSHHGGKAQAPTGHPNQTDQTTKHRDSKTAAPRIAAPGGGPKGSSGFGEVLGQATGSSSSGQLGLLLPLLIAGTVLWSLAYLWRQRRRVG